MIESEQQINKKSNTTTPKVFSWALYSEVGIEFAILIALPLLIFVFLGQILKFAGFEDWANWALINKRSSPLYNIVGLLISLVLSILLVANKVRQIKKIINE